MCTSRRIALLSTLLLALMLSVACGGQTQLEPTVSPAEPTAVAQAPQMGPITPFGTPEVRDLSPTSEVVSNCNGVTSPVVKHPSMTVGSSHTVEWQVGGSVGTGVTIGGGVVPGGVDLQATLEGHVANDLTNSIQQSNAWDLPADPGTIMEYTIMWREVWQPAYLDVTFMDPEPKIIRIDVKYRTGVQSDIVGQKATLCDPGAATQPTDAPPPTATPEPPQPTDIPQQPTNTPMPPTPSVSSSSFEVFANLSWQDTGVKINSGDSVRIIWDGKSRWRGINSGDFSDPLGGYSDPNANYSCTPLMSSGEAGWNAMVAKVGENGVVTNPFKNPPAGEGTLYLAMNDCDQQRYDNEGSAIVTIEVRQ
ncbi:MAG: hypothetical protein KIT52_00465 [Anaerolineae bacterium]|nr:hypothetical protein [Anaerolineae bacterium]